MELAARIKFIAIGIAIGLFAVVALQNRHEVQFQFLFWGVRVPQMALVFLTGGAGFVIGFIAGRFGGARRERA